MTDRKAVVKNADMLEDMQQHAVDCATEAIDKFNIEKVGHEHLLLIYCNKDKLNIEMVTHLINLVQLLREKFVIFVMNVD